MFYRCSKLNVGVLQSAYESGKLNVGVLQSAYESGNQDYKQEDIPFMSRPPSLDAIWF